MYQHPPYSGGTDRRAAVRGWHRALATLYSYPVSDQRQGLSLASTNVAAPLVASDTGGPGIFCTSGCSLAACSHTATQRVCRPTSWYSSLQILRALLPELVDDALATCALRQLSVAVRRSGAGQLPMAAFRQVETSSGPLSKDQPRCLDQKVADGDLVFAASLDALRGM